MRAALAVALLTACSDPPAQDGLTLAPDYDAAGVVRVFPDGLTPTSLETFGLALSGVQVSGGRAVGQVQRRGIGGSAIALSGTFDQETGDLQFDPASGALTSTRTESIAIAGIVEDGFPSDDGVADDLTGFVRSEYDIEAREGQFLAVSKNPQRPEPIDESMVTASAMNDGTILVTAAPGTAIPSVGVELLRFTVSKADPDFRVLESAADGGFTATIPGVAGDVLMIRNAPAGRRSDARIVRVQ